MNIDMTAVNLALAPIAVDLHLDIVSVQWIISAYLIGGASMVMLGGLLGDMYGHKKIFLMGALIFTLASLGVGFSTSEWSMIIMRLFQGFGAALAWPLAVVIVREAFVPREGLAMGLITGVMGASMSVGPPLGGVILHYLNWRWIFFINIPLGILVLLMGMIVLKKDIPSDTQQRLHMPSSFLLVIGLLLLIFSLNEMQHLGIRSPLILSTLIGGLLSLGIFVFLQKRVSNPLIDLALFKNKAINSCFIVRFLWQVIWTGLFLVLSLLFQNILGYSPLQTSAFFLIALVAFAMISPFGGKLTEIFSPRKLMMTSFIFYIIVFASFAVMTTATPIWQIGMIFFLFGAGSGIGFPSLLNVTLSLAPADRRGMVSGILYATLFSGGSIGAILVGSFAGSIAPKFLWHKLHSLGMSFSQNVSELLTASSTGVREVYKLVNDVPAHQAKTLIAIVQQSFFHAFTMIMVAFIIVGIVAMSFIWRIKSTFNS